MVTEATPIGEAFQAKVIEDSISPYGIRLVTFQLRYPRFIHAEFMTHRQFSRNARSSRAVPTKRLLEELPYYPHMLKNQPGMQGFEELDPGDYQCALSGWHRCANYCRDESIYLMDHNVHKQWANRMLEWFGYIDVVVSSTYWKNFFNLRDHPAAMPEIQNLALTMLEAMDNSTPKTLRFGEWHLPYILPGELEEVKLHNAKLLSTARCARVSYKPFDGSDADPLKDLALAERLIIQDPLHASPSEHQATPDHLVRYIDDGSWRTRWSAPQFHGNFVGWCQHRKMLPGEAYNEDYSFETCMKYYQENYVNAKVEERTTQILESPPKAPPQG